MNLGFVVSAPRSGSTWLMRSLSQHPEVFATELRLFGRFCELWPNAQGKPMPRMTGDQYIRALAGHFNTEDLAIEKPAFIESFTRDYFDFLIALTRRYANKPIIVDKITPYPQTSSIVRRGLQQHFPEARLIRLVRDGRDVLTSGAFDWLDRTDPELPRYQRWVEQRGEVRVPRFFDDEFLETWSQLWVDASTLLPGGCPLVTYEEMQLDQTTVLRKLFRHLEADDRIEWAQHCAQQTTFAKLSQASATNQPLAAKLRKGIVGDWRQYFTRRDGELFEAIAGDLLRRFGYEASPDWVLDLPQELTPFNA